MKKELGVIIGVVVALIVVVVLVVNFLFFPSYDVIFDSKGGTGIAVQNVKRGELVQKPNDPAMEGYIFLGWYLDESKYNFDTPVKDDLVLVGKWDSLTTPLH